MVLGVARRRPLTRKKPEVLLVFGEDDNDREAIRELVKALVPDAPPIEKRRNPLVLVKGREAAKARRNAVDIANIVRADEVRKRVRLVLAHQDCDAVEPAHELAVVPAWEMEAWWFLWPDAALAVNGRWRRPSRIGSRVGLVENAKEAFREALRPKTRGARVRDYEESDGPKIAAQVRALGCVDSPDAVSDSFARFSRRLREVLRTDG